MNSWKQYCCWMLFGVSCIACFPMTAAGQLLVADYANKIYEYNLDGSPGNFSLSIPYSPSAMAFGPGGDLFVASETTGTVYCYNWLAPTNPPTTISTGLNGIGGLLYDNASSTLYVSEFYGFTGQKIVKYKAGAQIGVLDVGDAAQGLAGMALGPDGSLYVSSYLDGTVYKGNSNTGNFTAVAGISGAIYGANGLLIDSKGNLDVVGMLTQNVIQFNIGATPAVPQNTTAAGAVNYPCDIVIDPNGNLLVSNMGLGTGDGFVGKYDSTDLTTKNSGFITYAGCTPTALLIEPAVWTGGAAGINGWKNAANWRGTPPTYALPIIFGTVAGGHATNFNDFDPGTELKGITFTAGAPQYTLQGNAIKLGGPVVNQSSSDQEIDLAMELVSGGGTFDTGNQNLTIGGLISGDGSLVKEGSGTLKITGGLTYTGLTDIEAGTLQIDTGASTALGDISGAVHWQSAMEQRLAPTRSM